VAEKNLSHRQVLEDVLTGAGSKRVPVALWRHFPVDDQDPHSLAAAAVDFQRSFDFDFVKLTPASSFCIKDWGVRDEWHGATEGTCDYTVHAIHEAEDWERLPVLDPGRGYLAAQLECLRAVVAEMGQHTPVVQTIFSPLAQAKNLVGKERLLVHLRRYPQAVHSVLRTIAESTRRFIEEARSTGVAGVFYAVQHAQYRLLSEVEFSEFGRAYDLEVLAAARDLWLNIVHLHGEEVMFDQVLDYPAAILNWHDRDTQPSLGEGLRRFRGVVCGGLQREHTMVLGTPQEVRAEALDALQATGGKRFILGTGCVVPITAPRANLLAARKAVEDFSSQA